MSDGKTHDAIGSLAAPVIAVVTLQLSGNISLASAIGLGELIGTIWLSPDLDLTSATIDTRWGGKFGELLWMPYDKILPHRSIISHGYGFGMIIRVAYIGVIIAGIALFFEMLGARGPLNFCEGVLQWIKANPSIAACFMAGLMLSETIHTITDHISTGFKRSAWKRHHHSR